MKMLGKTYGDNAMNTKSSLTHNHTNAWKYYKVQ